MALAIIESAMMISITTRPPSIYAPRAEGADWESAAAEDDAVVPALYLKSTDAISSMTSFSTVDRSIH